ncbi:Release factor glutamine methyltransferase [Caloramator mitchellensis]|uniref:Release factor glutamine methyltransferase n=1 Tax=Caloramator mitchellensis TaxID=908809 RepID=A0A0R3JW15_CALMK|nr:peptide chain release factor N(5)-glutamine methyltransferase [Caloramator mitchellensis]KRQ87753.1 Release factor glutamine methyltransferase [Caloramator mitchellensis]
MTIIEAIKYTKEILNKHNKQEHEAEILIGHVLNKDKLYLYCNPDEKLTDEQKSKLENALSQRISGRPLQYIIGYWEFYGNKFLVKEGVLIPRPDTEVLVEKALELIKDIKCPRIIDIGCGSGAISISIAKERDGSQVFAVDIEDVPLELTKQNAILNKVDDRVKVVKSNLLSAFDENSFESFDLIVSNPPYIKDEEIATLMDEVRKFEPITALSGGVDGLYFYREITSQSKKFLKKGGFIAYEIGHNQGEEVKTILYQNGFDEIKLYKDYAGLDRVVTALWQGKM